MSNNHISMNFINGEYRIGRSQNSFQNISPVNGAVISVVNEASESDVDDAVKAAKAALNGSCNVDGATIPHTYYTYWTSLS